MDLTVRPLEERDLGRCARLLAGRLAYPARVIPHLPDIWRRLLHEEAMHGVVFENRSHTGRAVMLSFCGSVFVTDAWVVAAKKSAEPYLTLRTLLSERRPVPGRQRDPHGDLARAPPAPEGGRKRGRAAARAPSFWRTARSIDVAPAPGIASGELFVGSGLAPPLDHQLDEDEPPWTLRRTGDISGVVADLLVIVGYTIERR